VYYKLINANVTNLDPSVVIEAGSPSDKVVDTQVKIGETVDDANDYMSVRLEVSRALSSLEQGVCRSGRSIH
jgi:hypothetical protein